MKIQTFSIVAGTNACNAQCPFCVSKMTGLPGKAKEINWHNLNKAALLAKMSGTTTVLITGKGEPTLFPSNINDYLTHLCNNYKFPFIELQTNGILMGKLAAGAIRAGQLNERMLEHWYNKGLNTIALSTCSIHLDENQSVYGKDYPDLGMLVDYLHSFGFTVRLCLMMHYGGVYSPGGIDQVIQFCQEYQVEQLTARNIRKPDNSDNETVSSFVEDNSLIPKEEEEIYEYIKENGTLIMKLEQGAEVYDVDGQNVCLSDCLTLSADENLRQLIFYPSGRVTYDWQYEGAVLLGGRKWH